MSFAPSPMSKVSICIPAYNAEEYLADALESVRSQTFSDWELIVTEDGSKDRTEELVSRFAALLSQPVRYQRHSVNRGLPATRNSGLSAANSEWIALLDDEHEEGLNFLGFFEDREEGHGYQKAKRQAAYGWFLRWLMNRGDGQPVQEPDTATLPFDSPELQCFPKGRKQPAGPGIIEAVKLLARKLPPATLEKVMGEMPQPVPITFRRKA